MDITKKNKKKDLRKTRKRKDISIIKEINREFENKLDYKLISELNNEFKNRMIHHSITIPSSYRKYSYYSEIKKGENYPKYYIIDNNQKHTCILDIETLGKSKSFYSVSNIIISNNEDYIFFSVDTIGNRYHTVFMKHYFNDEVTTLIDNVEGDIDISIDDKILYYLKMNDSMRSYKLFSYEFDNRNHKCIYTENDETFSLSLSKTSDRKHILLSSSSWESSHVYHVTSSNCKLLYKKEKDLYYYVDTYNDKWYIIYTKNNVSKIIYTTDFKEYKTLVANKKDIEYNNFIIKSHYLCAVYIEHGFNHLILIDLITNNIDHFRFDKNAVSMDFPSLSNLNICTPSIIINFYSNLYPKKVMELNCVTKKLELIQENKINGYDETKYREKILKVNDKLCITMIYRKDKLKKNMKCLLNGYGAYGTILDPFFNSNSISLLDRGFLFCTAHVRGGGYNGNKWYKDGKLLHKMNSFKDFIECSKYLIKNNYTSREKLAIWGRSAGGLLIGAVINMEPELFNLAILGVPFVDLINTMMDTSKPLTLEEYKEWGNPHIKKYYNYMKKYDPMNNIDLSNKYPNIFIYSNLEDTLVEYKEPFNYYMKIKEADVFKNNEREILMNINLKYGHVQSSKRYEGLNEFAIYYSILINTLK